MHDAGAATKKIIGEILELGSQHDPKAGLVGTAIANNIGPSQLPSVHSVTWHPWVEDWRLQQSDLFEDQCPAACGRRVITCEGILPGSLLITIALNAVRCLVAQALQLVLPPCGRFGCVPSKAADDAIPRRMALGSMRLK